MNIERTEILPEKGHNKFYIMAMAATGKTTFAGQNEAYLGYRVVDYAGEKPEYSFVTKALLSLSRVIRPLRRLAVRRPDMAGHFKESYFDKAINFMREHDGPIVLLGRRTLDDFDHQKFEGEIAFSMVMLSEDDHREHCATRKKHIRNPRPFFHHWTTDFEKIKRLREAFQAHAQKHGIPMYRSIPAAIEEMHRENSSDAAIQQ